MPILRLGFLAMVSSFWISSPLGCRWLDTNNLTEFVCLDQFFFSIAHNRSLTVNCHGESAELGDLPDLTALNLQSLDMQDCSLEMFNQVWKKAQMENITRLNLR